MTRYAALLRGINVGGKSRLAMPDLRRVLGELGLPDVEIYLQTGNVAFSSDLTPAVLSDSISRAVLDSLGVTTSVLLRTGAELATLAAGNPYAGRTSDPKLLHVTFLAAAPSSADVPVPAGETAECTVAGPDVYLYVPDGYGRTKLNNAYLERKLGVEATTRNWRTVLRLAEMTA